MSCRLGLALARHNGSNTSRLSAPAGESLRGLFVGCDCGCGGLDPALDLAPDARGYAVDLQGYGCQCGQLAHRFLRWVNAGVGFQRGARQILRELARPTGADSETAERRSESRL